MLLLSILLLLFLQSNTLYAQSNDTAPAIVISEIHYNPQHPTERIEFVELHNAGSRDVNLTGWQLDVAVQYTFAFGVVIPAGGYLVVAEAPDSLQARYGVAALGPYTGKLANEGDEIVLRDSLADEVDVVGYEPRFPWPVVGDAPGPSIQLIHPGLDNELGGHWRRAEPTPGRVNHVRANRAPPHVEGVQHRPQSPRSGEEVEILATVIDPDGVRRVTLHYQIVAPGAYIRRHDPAYAANWQLLPMTRVDEDGDLYRAELPGGLQLHRHLIRYRIEAIDAGGAAILAPTGESDEPNFAYFVYDGAPAYQGAIDGNPAAYQTFDFAQMRPLPIYHLLADKIDVADALFIPPSTRAEGYTGNDYPWYGTFVYDGEVYDHITFRARGGSTRYATGKNMMKFNFNRGHRFRSVDDHGRPYDVDWDKLNLSAVIQQSHRRHRGEQGLFESLGFRLFNLVGVEASLTHFVHLRVVDDASESGGNQYEGDFWGLYLAIEQPDGRFLKQHDLADGNLYKMENWTGELNNQGPTAATDKSDLNYFMHTYTAFRPPADWWRSVLDLDRYYSYRSIVEAIHHYDIGAGKNYFYFLNPKNNKWSVHPWDLDLTWSERMPGNGEEPLADRILHGDLKLEYRNRLREIRDLLFNEEQMGLMIDEHARIINSAAGGPTMVDADRVKWDYNPVFHTRYVDPKRTAMGDFYTATGSRSFEGMVGLVKEWVQDRSAWIDANLTADLAHPSTPGIGYIGDAGFPADKLRFATSEFRDPQGGQTFAAMEWRLAEITDTGAADYDPNAPVMYEIDALWESGELPLFSFEWAPPPGLAQPNHTYRVRVRVKDSSGRWSHWSAPLQFRAAAPLNDADTTIYITEIMYNAANVDGIAGEHLEYIELRNSGDYAIDLSFAFFNTGIEYTFPPGAKLEAGAYLVLATDADSFLRVYGFEPYATFDKRLDNGGEEITLLDAYGRILSSVTYDDNAPWPVKADGDGYSLVWDEAGWRQSTARGGSPGISDPRRVLINEILTNPGPNTTAYVELYNPNSEDADISHWRLSNDSEQPHKYRFAAGTVIPANGYLIITAAELQRQSAGSMVLSNRGQDILLSSATASGRLTGYQHGFRVGSTARNVAWGRYVTSHGLELLWPQAQQSRASVNTMPRIGPVVISEIMYAPRSGEEYIELTNISDQPVELFDAADPQRTWRMDGIAFAFPAGLTLPAAGKLVLTTTSPTRICLDYELDGATEVIGPYTVQLGDDGHELRLLKPGPDSTYIVVDGVTFTDRSPWPAEAAGGGAALVRKELDSWGPEPLNWRAGDEHPLIRGAANQAPYAALCSFELKPSSDRERMELQWVTRQESNVNGYNVWHSQDGDRSNATLITTDLVLAQSAAERLALYSIDIVDSGERSVFWLQAVGPDGQASDVGQTQPRRELSTTYLPVVNWP